MTEESCQALGPFRVYEGGMWSNYLNPCKPCHRDAQEGMLSSDVGWGGQKWERECSGVLMVVKAVSKDMEWGMGQRQVCFVTRRDGLTHGRQGGG